MSWNDFRQFVFDGVEHIRQAFQKPDDDWMPVAILEEPGGETSVYDTIAEPEDMAQMVVDLVRNTGACRVARVNSAWRGTPLPPGTVPEAGMAINDPNRTEVLIVTFFDSSQFEYWWAPILRDGEAPPKLGDWAKEDSVTGIQIDPVRRALREVQDERQMA